MLRCRVVVRTRLPLDLQTFVEWGRCGMPHSSMCAGSDLGEDSSATFIDLVLTCRRIYTASGSEVRLTLGHRAILEARCSIKLAPASALERRRRSSSVTKCADLGVSSRPGNRGEIGDAPRDVV